MRSWFEEKWDSFLKRIGVRPSRLTFGGELHTKLIKNKEGSE